jgi:hypothetical protein
MSSFGAVRFQAGLGSRPRGVRFGMVGQPVLRPTEVGPVTANLITPTVRTRLHPTGVGWFTASLSCLPYSGFQLPGQEKVRPLMECCDVGAALGVSRLLVSVARLPRRRSPHSISSPHLSTKIVSLCIIAQAAEKVSRGKIRSPWSGS